MAKDALTSLAILKVNWDNSGRDYADNFLPFVVEAVQLLPQPQISVSELQQTIRNHFGLLIPQGALNTLLRRAVRHGAVERRDGIFVRHATNPNPDFQRTRQEFSRTKSALIDKLTTFVSGSLGLSWTAEQAEVALLKHLQHACIPILAAATEGLPIPIAASDVKHTDYAINRFVLHLYEKDPPGFTFLETLTKGSMLATALFLPEIGNANKKFKNLTIYVDTTLLLRALGLEGKGLQEPMYELLHLLYELNVDLACFDITQDEIRRILDAAELALQDPKRARRGLFSVYEHLISDGKRASDVELIIARLVRDLKSLHVNVRSRPLHEASLTLNEELLNAILDQELPNQGADARRHDIDCITSIHRLRRGQSKSDIETCEYIFLTTNNGLGRAAARYFIEEDERIVVPLCINDHTMATLAWVKNPRLAEQWARHRLIADSYAALHPSNELWRKYHQEIDKLQARNEITAEECDVLRLSMVARNALMDSTLGSPDAFSEGTVPEVLAAANAAIKKDALDSASKEQVLRLAAEARATDAALALDSLKSNQRIKAATIGIKVGRCAKWGTLLGIGAIAMYGFWMTLPDLLVSDQLKIAMATPIAILLFFALAAWSLFSGGTVRKLARGVEAFVSRKSEGWISRWFY